LIQPDGGNWGGRQYHCGVQVTAQIGQLCGGYLLEVKDARKDTERLYSKILALHDVPEKSVKVVEGSTARLPVSKSVLESLKRCEADLENLKTKLGPGKDKRQKAMRRIGLRALK
jgi:hypothetical protein